MKSESLVRALIERRGGKDGGWHRGRLRVLVDGIFYLRVYMTMSHRDLLHTTEA